MILLVWKRCVGSSGVVSTLQSGANNCVSIGTGTCFSVALRFHAR
jgi:hypothetical protein